MLRNIIGSTTDNNLKISYISAYRGIPKPIIIHINELHISNIYKREEFRHKSLISDVVTGGIFGLGENGYILAIIAMQKLLKKWK